MGSRSRIQTSRRLTATFFLLCSLALTANSAAGAIALDAPAGSRCLRFLKRVNTALAGLARSGAPPIGQLYEAINAVPGTIRFRPISDDPATWSKDGVRFRGHTELTDISINQEWSTRSTNAAVFLPERAVINGTAPWSSGVFVHELVHALDLAFRRLQS